jgi:acetylornithine/N-succinyldiaminopimelate aminotransferase
MLKYETIFQLDQEFVLKTYNRMPALFVQGSGCTLWDNRGNEYLDFLAGIAVCQLGHCHPAVVAAITRQAQQLIHTSNILLSAPQAQLAQKLCRISGMDKVFFCNDGTTSLEGAIKIAKKHGNAKRPEGDYEIITLMRSFHGRSIGALSATGQRKYQRAFEPLVPGFVHVPIDDVTALREAVSHKTAAIILEPIMGEGNVHVLSSTYLQEASRLAREHDALLILDEVQCGIGRSGKWFAYQHLDLKPDVVCVAKGLGGGLPIGAVLTQGLASEILQPGDHGSTFGGNPLVCAAGLAVLDTIEDEGLLDHVTELGQVLGESLSSFSAVESVSGAGFMWGATLKKPIAKDVVKACFEKGLIINATDETTLRLVPPLILTADQAQKGFQILAQALGESTPVIRPVGRVVVPSASYGDVLGIDSLTDNQLVDVLQLAMDSKLRRRLAPGPIQPVENRSIALVFEKPSLRTRVSFETAIQELGGSPIYLSKADIGMGTRESIRDVATNLARWCSVIVARLYWHRDLELLAKEADVPVVNALTEWEHPCQALADLLTIQENFGDEKVKITYVGDGNNVSRSLAKLALRLGYSVSICGPENFQLEPMPGLVQTPDLDEGLSGAKVVYTDVWVSMGDEHEQEHRLKVFDRYQVNQATMRLADEDAIFLHCLPARRGFEVTDDVMDGSQSRVVDQAENRLHAQKALLQKVLGI